MQDYEIWRGHQKELDGGRLKAMMQEAFGEVSEEGAFLVAKYGALAKLTVGWDGKNSLKVETVMDPKVAPDVAQSIIKGDSSRAAYRGIIEHLVKRGAQGIIAGCTEIELLVREEDSAAPLFPTTRIHAVAAVDRALQGAGSI